MQKKTKKEKYEKPELKAIHLHAEEVLGIGCKTSSSGMSIGVPCAGSTCTAVGS